MFVSFASRTPLPFLSMPLKTVMPPLEQEVAGALVVTMDTPVLGSPSLPALYSADAGAYTPLQGRAYSTRLPLFHQLDLRVDKRWQFKTWRFSSGPTNSSSPRRSSLPR